MYFDTVLCCIAIFLVAYLALRRLRDPLRPIPGPIGLPYLGQTLLVDFSKLHLKLDEWKHIYGPVMRWTMMGSDIVVLSGIDVIREALLNRGTDFAGRPPAYRAQRLTYGKDIAFQNFSRKTVALRKMAIKALRPYGTGMSRLETIMAEAAAEFVDEIGSKNGESFEIARETDAFVCNVICTVLYGERVALDDPSVQLVTKANHVILETLDPTTVGREIDAMPWLRYTFLGRRGMAVVENAERLRSEVLEKKLHEAQDTLNPACPRGCLDQFLLAMEHDLDETGQPMWDAEHMSALCIDFLGAGMNTTSAALSGMYLLLLHHPELQIKLQNEIDSVVGRARAPTLHDTESMPYTNAFVLETLRYISLFPISPPKMTITDTSVGGYCIPAGTTVYINIWSVHHDEIVYPDPFEFRPERFLDKCGALLPHDHPTRNSFIAFGLGRRICIGEHLSRSRLLLLMTTLLQRFTLVKDDSSPLANVDPRTFTMGLMLDPPKTSLRAVARF